MNRPRGTQSREIRQLLSILEQAYDHRSWHGTNLRGSIRGVSLRRAAWRPGRGRHNIWELVVHAAYWKYAAGRRIAGTPRGAFPFEGSNWFRRPEQKDAASERAWRADLAVLDDMHLFLCAAVSSLSPGSLYRAHRGSAETSFSLITGAAAHDLYHAGQIQLLKKLGAR
jgi:hypothetical protein